MTGPHKVIEIERLSRLYSYERRSGGFFLKTRRPGRAPFPSGIDTHEPGPRKGTFWALKDVAFDLNRGDSVGIIGRNGAGKSTLLKILSRVLRPTEGSVMVRGRLHSLLKVGSGFHPELSGRKNIYLCAALLGLRKRDIESRLDAIIDFSGIGPFIDTAVKYYSAGMYVRLAFSIGIHVDPDILVLDEVITVGDAVFQERCDEKISEIKARGCTILLATHDFAKLQRFCSKAVWLKGGKIREIGIADEVCRNYLSEFQAAPVV